MPDLIQFLRSINNTKDNLFSDPDLDPVQTEKDYTKLAYIINRCVSYHPDTIFYAQEMNMRSSLDGKPQYIFYLHGVSKRPRYAKGMKADNPEHLEIVKDYYGYSTKKARKALEVLSLDDIEYIKARSYKGGLSKNK